jgi:dTDP-4-amino-4,6-dideoxygalactose transaminase
MQNGTGRLVRRNHASTASPLLAPTPEIPQFPLIRPDPPRLSCHAAELAEIEASGVFSNYGPVNQRFEHEVIRSIFGEGACLTVCNATIGLMLAIREGIGDARPAERRYALMPSFTFAATAQAALWCGLTPLLCDIDPETWLPSAEQEDWLLRKYRGQIAVIVPYATFGNCLDLARYAELAQRHGVPVVVDAAASLGSLDIQGRPFAAGFPWPVVFSMHATKAFSVGEGGLVYCADEDRLSRLRAMGSFGFEQPRIVTTIGLNSKLSEVSALTALLQLERFPAAITLREKLLNTYGAELGQDFQTQQSTGIRQIQSFQSIVLPAQLAPLRDAIVTSLRTLGVSAATYFSPHLAQHPYLRDRVAAGSLTATDSLASRILSLPLLTSMSEDDVRYIASCLRQVAAALAVAA